MSHTTEKDPCCPSCHRPEQKIKIDYGDFTHEEIHALEGRYVLGILRGCIGWGVSFIDWVEVTEQAKHDKRHRLLKIKPDNLEEKLDVATLQDPEMVKSAEYRAIHELLENVENKKEAMDILQEFEEHIKNIRNQIQK